MTTFDIAAATNLLNTVFAPWVRDLNLSVESIGADGATLRMRFSERLCRSNGVICGQALMSLADTSMAVAICVAAGRRLSITTVDLTTHFMRPAMHADTLAEARVLRMGRTMAYGSVLLSVDGDPRPVAMVQTAYALLREDS
jgi:uncharacterized protein (TIGR00369 family)